MKKIWPAILAVATIAGVRFTQAAELPQARVLGQNVQGVQMFISSTNTEVRAGETFSVEVVMGNRTSYDEYQIALTRAP